ncbi:MAG: RnfABCDGE type electron transport complex subunit D [Eubacteriales bacterium]
MTQLKDFFQKQKMMTKVLLSLLPILLLSIYFFGLRTLLILSVVTITGILCEYGIMRLINGEKAKVSEALLVSCALFTLTLPPAVPLWIASVGIAFGVIFGKCVFGGFGKNIFNPALVGRCFIYVSFPAHMTVTWAEPYSGLFGGFVKWSSGIDAVTSATPMILMNKEGIMTNYINLFLGNVAGSIGETSALLIILAAVYLIVTKTASWKIMISSLASFTILGSILYFSGVTAVNPLFAILSGGFLFATVFMATDPVSAPRQDVSKYIYGALIGIVAMVIREFSIFTEGIMFAILIINAFVPLIDRNIKILKEKKSIGKKVET